jgi:hypothetical protein
MKAFEDFKIVISSAPVLVSLDFLNCFKFLVCFR